MSDLPDSFRHRALAGGNIDTSRNAFNSESPGIRHLKAMSPVHYIALIGIIIVVVLLIVIMKRYFIKFATFYIVRRDYLRLNAVSKANKEANEETC